jgi:hypothetical protein
MDSPLNADSMIAFMEECYEVEKEINALYDQAASVRMATEIASIVDGEHGPSIMVALAIVLSEIAAASPDIKLTCAVVGNVASSMARSSEASSARH